MKHSRLHYLLRDPDAAAGFRTGVSLHSHTMYSKESMAFIERLARRSKPFDWFIRTQLTKYAPEREAADLGAEVRRIWWTSPLSAKQAFDVESDQIAGGLGLKPIVSITDHDNIDAPMQLQMLVDNGEAPVSVEWTTPYRDTYLHMGVHNLAPARAAETMERMERYTGATDPDPRTLGEIFRDLAAVPGALIVLNHPYWDQPWIGPARHDARLREFVAEFRHSIHALEINGLRSWQENRKVVRLAQETELPLISGGDRHGREPNATLNLTNAATFAEFAEEIRGGETSRVLVMPHFHDPLVARIFQGLWDVMAEHAEHAEGRVHWSQRVFRRCEDEEVRSLDRYFPQGEPFLTKRLLELARFASSRKLRPAWKAMAFRSEMAL